MKNKSSYAEIVKILRLSKITDNFYTLISLNLSIIALLTLLFYPLHPYFDESLEKTLKNFHNTAPFHLKLSFFAYFLASITLLANFCMALLLNNTKLHFLTIFWDNIFISTKLSFFSSILFIFSYPIVAILGISSSILIATSANHYKNNIKFFNNTKETNNTVIKPLSIGKTDQFDTKSHTN